MRAGEGVLGAGSSYGGGREQLRRRAPHPALGGKSRRPEASPALLPARNHAEENAMTAEEYWR